MDEMTMEQLHGIQGGMSVASKLSVFRRSPGEPLFPLVGRIGVVGYFRDRWYDRPAGSTSTPGGCAGSRCSN